MKRLWLALAALGWLLGLGGMAEVQAAPDRVRFDVSALVLSLPAQICNRSETSVVDNDGRITLVKLTPSDIAVQGGQVVNWNGKTLGQLFISPSLYTNATLVDLALRKGARVGQQNFRALWTAHYEDGRFAVMLSDPDAQTLAILRGETPNVPLAQGLKVEFAPAQEPNALKMSVFNGGSRPLSLRWGDDGTGDNPRSDPMLFVRATRQGKAVPPKANPWPMGTLGPTFVLAPGQKRERLIALADYLALEEAGPLEVSVHYTLELANPTPKSKPAEWNIGFDVTIPLQIAATAPAR